MRTIGGIKIPDRDSYRVESTFDYSKFRFIEGNRNADHVSKLEYSYKNCGLLLQPILVNEKFEIVEGQNRFCACINLGLPVYYIVQEGIRLKEVMSLNSASKNWVTRDFIHCYAAGDQNLNYIYAETLMKAYPWASQSLIAFAISGMSGCGKAAQTFKEGDLVCTENEYNKAVAMLDYVEQFNELISGIQGKKHMYLVALSFCFKCDKVDNDYLATKMKKYGYALEPATSIMDAMRQIETKIYNYNLRSPREPVFVSGEYEKYVRANKRRKKNEG